MDPCQPYFETRQSMTCNESRECGWPVTGCPMFVCALHVRRCECGCAPTSRDHPHVGFRAVPRSRGLQRVAPWRPARARGGNMAWYSEPVSTCPACCVQPEGEYVENIAVLMVKKRGAAVRTNWRRDKAARRRTDPPHVSGGVATVYRDPRGPERSAEGLAPPGRGRARILISPHRSVKPTRDSVSATRIDQPRARPLRSD